VATFTRTSRGSARAIGLLVIVRLGTGCSGAPDPLGLMTAVSAPETLGTDGGAGAAIDAGGADASLPPHAGTGDALSQVAWDAGVIDTASPAESGIDEPAPGDADQDAPVDGTLPRASCAVSFTVADAYIDGIVDTEVAVGGNIVGLGSFDPEAAPAMTSIGTGAWSLTMVLYDGDQLQFRFVKRGPNSFIWEDWGANSNRSLTVACSPSAAQASVDGGPAIGTAYTGDFDVKPPDAT
jgi:hypothetical protein